jgi:hypothetical protein
MVSEPASPLLGVGSGGQAVVIFLGYLDRGHYNFSGLEKCHYYSRILKFATTILDFPRICHGIRMKTTWA